MKGFRRRDVWGERVEQEDGHMGSVVDLRPWCGVPELKSETGPRGRGLIWGEGGDPRKKRKAAAWMLW